MRRDDLPDAQGRQISSNCEYRIRVVIEPDQTHPQTKFPFVPQH